MYAHLHFCLSPSLSCEHTCAAFIFLAQGDEADTRFAVSRWDRLMVFAFCNLGALACFVICFALLPVMATRPKKFVTL